MTNILNINNQNPAVQEMENNPAIYSNFILNYLNKQFFSNLINTLVFHADLTLVVPSSNNIEIFNYLKKFIYDLSNDLKENNDLTIPKQHYFTLLSLTKQLINIRADSSYSFINYENLLQHFNSNNQFVISILQNVVDNPLISTSDFQKLFDSIIQDIEIYNQMQVIKSTIFKWNMFINESNNESKDISALNWVKHFKDTILEANSSLSELTVLKQNETATDYLMFYDEQSISDSLCTILNFLKTSYRTYQTGYELLDNNISGIESSSVIVISGPSNHAKSIFMLNVCKSLMELNESKDDNDVFIFITLEDDINKLFKRILSIFGNYDTKMVKSLYQKSSEILQNADDNDNVLGQDIVDNVTSILKEITNESILTITQGKKRFVIKHSSENSFSMGDASRFIDSLEIQGLKVRALYID